MDHRMGKSSGSVSSLTRSTPAGVPEGVHGAQTTIIAIETNFGREGSVDLIKL